MMPPESLDRPKAETEDAPPRLVGAMAASLVLIIGFGLLGGLLMVRPADFESEKVQRGSVEFFEHGPVDLSEIDRSWAEVNRSSASESDGYAWIDRRVGTVRVPIGRAIDLICAEQGRPIENRAEGRDLP